MAQSRSRSRTPPRSYRKNDSSEGRCREHRHRSRRHGHGSSRRRRHHYRSISSPSSISETSACSSCRSTPTRSIRPVDPPKSTCLGVFGLSSYTTEANLMDVFSPYGTIDKAMIVYDAKTKASRGFGFVYFQEQSSATEAKLQCNGMELHERTIRVDYSVTERPHTPTPGVYMGARCTEKRKHRSTQSYRGRSYDDDYHHHHRRSRRSRSRSRHRQHRSSYRRHHRRDRSPSYSSSIDSRRSYR
nr:transformer-2 protein homolog alpha-like [Aedes albopictus]